MATTYYQPGVYIQEIDAPSSSVTSVQTAIPAFIGYTAMAQAVAPNDLLFVPFQINSLLEYVQYYGPGPGPSVKSVHLDANYNFISADVEIKYKMYDAVRLFFLNGGGTAYIVSVGLYTATPFNPLTSDYLGNGSPTAPGAFVPLARLQQPTLLVFPNLDLFMNNSGSAEWAILYTTALQQCATVQSTFLIGDFYYNATLLQGTTTLENLYSYQTSTYDYQNEVNTFRQNLGMNNLNYGAIYGPWVDILPSSPITYALISQGQLYVGGVRVQNLSSLAGSPQVALVAQDVEDLLQDIQTINSTTTGTINSVIGTSTVLISGSLYPSGSLSNSTTPSVTINNPPPAITLPSPISNLGILYTTVKSLSLGGAISAVEGVEYIYFLAYSIATTVTQLATTLLTDSDLVSYIYTGPNGLVPTTLASLYDDLAQLENYFATGSGNALSLSTWKALTSAFTGTVAQTANTGSVYIVVNGAVVGTFTTDANITEGTLATFIGALYSANGAWSSANGWQVSVDSSGDLSIIGPLTTTGFASASIGLYTTAGLITGHASLGAAIQLNSFGSATALNTYNPQFTSNNFNLLYTLSATSTPWTISPAVNTVFNDHSAPSSTIAWTASTPGNLALAIQALDPLMNQIIAAYNTILPWAQADEANLEVNLVSTFPAFANIINGVNSTPIPFPPSGAMAGVYANIDNDFGVWKAPANTSIDGIVGPDWAFDSANYDDLNIDLQAGKSINAIRTFTGRGTLVWGARTLAGNDPNWRYVSVRRFFIMVEQSVKLALNTYVFEPNSPPTWNAVISEVSAYLYSLWRAGALLGTKPSDAFMVQCGLGTTMTQTDIQNGNMIVLIGMAVVRPAEFIILQFTQQVGGSGSGS